MGGGEKEEERGGVRIGNLENWKSGPCEGMRWGEYEHVW